MNWFIGIDGGGTCTRAVIANPAGVVLGTGRAGSSNYHGVGIEHAAESIGEAISLARAEARVSGYAAGAFLGIAGVRTVDDHRAFKKPLALLGLVEKADRLVLDHDLRIALAGGRSSASGIVVVAGTGAAAYGRDESGGTAIAGGCGWLLDDQGGGTWIALQALRAVMEASDGRIAATKLEPALFAELNVRSPREAMVWAQRSDLPRGQLAALAPVVLAAAADGDAAAQAIVEEGAHQLARMVIAITERLQCNGDEISVVPAGGLLSDGIYRQALMDTLAEREPRVKIVAEAAPPIAGAVLLAAEAAGTPMSHAARLRLAAETRTKA